VCGQTVGLPLRDNECLQHQFRPANAAVWMWMCNCHFIDACNRICTVYSNNDTMLYMLFAMEVYQLFVVCLPVLASLPIPRYLGAIWAHGLKEICRSITFEVSPSVIYRQALIGRFLCRGLLRSILVPPSHLLLETRNAESHVRIRRILSHSCLLLLE